MNRRQFLTGLASALVLPAAAVEIWQPTKTLFLPPSGGWITPALRGNTLLTVSYLTNEALRILEADIRFEKFVGNQFDGRRYGKICVNTRALEYFNHVTR